MKDQELLMRRIDSLTTMLAAVRKGIKEVRADVDSAEKYMTSTKVAMGIHQEFDNDSMVSTVSSRIHDRKLSELTKYTKYGFHNMAKRALLDIDAGSTDGVPQKMLSILKEVFEEQAMYQGKEGVWEGFLSFVADKAEMDNNLLHRVYGDNPFVTFMCE